ncbi:MAG: hypothetical protein Q9226_007358, partial [Calogaya cf. arnoldii]
NEHSRLLVGLKESERSLETLITDSLYEKLLSRTLDFERDLLRKAFVWLACAVRSLTASELAEAIVIRDGVYELGPDDRLPRPTDVLEIGGSLFLCDPRTKQVKFAHSSLRQYLLSQEIKSGPAATFALSEDECHRQILVSCLTYLQSDIRTTTGSWSELQEVYETPTPFIYPPLYKYCVLNWTKHVNTPALDEMVPHLAPKLFQLADTRFLTSLIQCRRQLEPQPEAGSTQDRDPTYSDPISYAAAEGLYASVRALLALGDVPNAPTESEIQLESPLRAAILANQFEITRLLINAGASIVAPHPKHGSAIQIAAGAGFQNILRLLLDRADELQLYIDCPRNDDEKPKKSVLMHLCSGTGDLECARMLLSVGAVSARKIVSRLELSTAIKKRHYNLVQLLLRHETLSLPDDRAWVGNLISDQGERAVDLTGYCLQQKFFGVSDRIRSGQTLLHVAATWDNTKVVQLLLEAGADPNARKDTPLHFATSAASMSVIDLLMKYGADPHAQGFTGRTSIQCALLNYREEVVCWAISKGADVNIFSTPTAPPANQGNTRVVETPLIIATKDGRWNIVKLLLASGADPNLPAHAPWTVLCDAAAGSAPLEIIELVADASTDIRTVVNPPGPSLMEVPVTQGSAATVGFLLSKGANAEQQTSGSTLLFCAVYDGHLSVVEALLAGGADVNARNSKDGYTALMAAVLLPSQLQNLPTQFLHAEDDVRMYGGPYIKPDLESEERRRCESITQYLNDPAIEYRHDDRHSDMSEKIISLLLAARHERIAIIRTLMRAGADINAVNNMSMTALHEASISGSKAIVKLLLGYGADIYARDRRGCTPLDAVQEPRQVVWRQGIIRLLAAVHQLAGDTGSWVDERFVLD